MKRISVIALMLAALATTPARAVTVERTDFRPVMSDGVGLEASVYLPAGVAPDAELPLIVRQHGGGSTKDNAYDVGYTTAAVETGRFAALMYSHRGHGGSDGLFDFFGARTTLDFSEMLDAVEATFGARVDTSNVGVSGYSQGGGESLLPAAADDRVKAAAVGQTFANLNHALNPNDCFKASWATGIFAAAYKSAGARTQDDLAVRWGATWFTDTEDVSVPGGPLSTTADANTRSPDQLLSQIDIPVFWTQAWEDQLFPGDHPERVLAPLQARGIPVHYWFSSGGHARGPNFEADEVAREAAMVRWFEEFLLGDDNGYASGAQPVVDFWQRTAAGRPGMWVPRTAPSWPVPSTIRSFYPHDDGSLGDPAADEGVVGSIVNPAPSANLANDDIVYEVAGRIPGVGDVVKQIPEDPLNGVRFDSAPLTEQVDVTGAPLVSVPIETTALSVVQLNAKVWDVSDEGATLIWRGCGSFENPGSTLQLPLWPNSHVFPVGHRIALTLAATDAAMFKPDVEPAVTKILSGARLDLPTQ